MEFVHACAFCGWSRAAATAIVAPPGCPSCGCPIDSRQAVHGVVADVAGPRAARADAVWLRRGLLTAFGLALTAAAARVGYDIAALPGAITAIGAAGYLLLPFVPEQLGPAGG